MLVDMKNLFLLSLTVLLSWSASPITQSNVYLCDSSGGKKYHFSKNCRGLSNCQHEIIKVTLKKAQSLGKTLCGHED